MAYCFRTDGMLLGAASAATQIEGGDRNNSWYDWYEKGHIKDGSDPSVTTMHWERWEEDAALMRDMGLQCCRLGLEWSRLEPERGVFDDGALAHYRQELARLREYGILPMVTLWHFTNPLWFERGGGFLGATAKADYLAFVEYAVRGLGDLADCWITLNEPNVYAVNGYMDGSWPPGERDVGKTLRVMDALADCHVAAYRLIHRLLPGARVSFANHLRDFAPRDAKNPAHQAAARASEYLFQTALTRVMMTGRGGFPLKSRGRGRYYDYIAVNYYTRSTCEGLGDGVRAHAPVNDLGWEIWPEGLGKLVRRLYARYRAPVYITENGTCDNADAFRCRYLCEHLRVLAELGCVARYYHWCFCDNFEWLEGGSARFGLVHVDYATQARRVKRSGRFFAEIIKNGGVTEEMYEAYVAPQQYHER